MRRSVLFCLSGGRSMVAVIAGNGLGLGNTSLTQLGQTSGGQPNIGQAGVGQYLNLATGNLILQSTDEGLVFDGCRSTRSAPTTAWARRRATRAGCSASPVR